MNGRLWCMRVFVASRKQWVRLVYLTIITTLQGLLNISKCGPNPPLPPPLHTRPPPPPRFSASHVVLWNDRLHVLTRSKSDTHGALYHCWRLHCLTSTGLFANVRILKKKRTAMQKNKKKTLQSSRFVSDNLRVLTLSSHTQNIKHLSGCLTNTVL